MENMPQLRLLETLINHMPDFIYVKDSESRFVLCNKAVACCLGIDRPEDALGKTDMEFHSPEKARRYFEDERQVLETGKALVGHEEVVVFPDGTRYWYSSTKVPLTDESGSVVGIIGIGRDITERKRAEDQVKEYAEEMRRRNDELEADLKLAHEFQRAMLPRQLSRIEWRAGGELREFAIERRYIAMSGVSGDFLAVREISDNRLGVLLCDAIGHGVRAALMTAILEGVTKEVKDCGDQPEQLLSVMNGLLGEAFKGPGGGYFVTAVYFLIDLESETVSFARAGHHSPLLQDGENGSVRVLDESRPGPALALLPEMHYRCGRCSLKSGVRLFACTDGLTEAADNGGDQFGEAGILSYLEQHAGDDLSAVCDGLLDEARRFSGKADFDDDVCLVAMSYRSQPLDN